MIDIRGCRAGANPDYLKAVAKLFGAGATRPKVTGPDRFQSFPTPDTAPFDAPDAAALVVTETLLVPELNHWTQTIGLAASITPDDKKFISYCDEIVLPVPKAAPVTGFHEGLSVFTLGDPAPGNSAFGGHGLA